MNNDRAKSKSAEGIDYRLLQPLCSVHNNHTVCFLYIRTKLLQAKWISTMP